MKKLQLFVIVALVVASCSTKPKQKPVTKLPAKTMAFDYKSLRPPPPPGLITPPMEIPMTTVPLTEYIRTNDKVACYIGEAGFVFWDAAGRTNILPVTVDALGKSFELTSGSMVVAGYKGFNGGAVSNYLIEYRLDYSNGLPVAANMVYDKWFNPNGRWVKTLKTKAGGIVVASFKWTGQYNNSIAYRNPSGEWSYYEKNYTDPQQIIPAFNLEVQEGNDGNIYIFTTRDSSHNISLARWKESNNGLSFVDFRYDFLTDKCNFVFTQTICRDGVMTPQSENPWIKSAKDGDDILLSYQSHDAKSGCDSTLARPVIARIKTFPQPHDAYCYKPGFQAPPPNNINIVYQTCKTVPGVPYCYQASYDLVNWQDVPNLDTIQTDMVATGNEMSFRVFHPNGGAQRYNFKTVARSYIRQPEVVLSGYCERVTTFVPMMGSYAWSCPQTAECDDFTWKLSKVVNGVESNIPINYTLAAWGCGWIVKIKPDGSVWLERKE